MSFVVGAPKSLRTVNEYKRRQALARPDNLDLEPALPDVSAGPDRTDINESVINSNWQTQRANRQRHTGNTIIPPGSQPANPAVLPSSIEQALQFFDSESTSEKTPYFVHSVQTLQAKPKSEFAPAASPALDPDSSIEKDVFGQVTKARFHSGEQVSFQYNYNGELCAFNYAGLDWRLTEYGFWAANDRQTNYLIEGTVEVLSSGALRIRKDDVARTISLDGIRTDEHKSGSRTESRKAKQISTAYDLLATAQVSNSTWLSPQSNFSEPAEIQQAEAASAFISSSKNSSVSAPTNESKKAVRLRHLEHCLSHRPEESQILGSFKRNCLEYYVKARLWLIDRVQGQSSAKHLPYLDKLATVYVEKQQNDLAELTQLRALHIREQYYGVHQAELAINVSGLARINQLRGNNARAQQLYKEAAGLYQKGLRKSAFMYSRGVISASKLILEVEALLSCLLHLAELDVPISNERWTLTFLTDLLENNPVLESALRPTVESYQSVMQSANQV